MMRWDVINSFVEKYKYKSYLELGYYKGWSFDQVKCLRKDAVDPNPSKDHVQQALKYGDSLALSNSFYHTLTKMTSDNFFEGREGSGKWDIIFIDGLHEAEQVMKDIHHSLDHLNPGGIIVLHDCNPPKFEHTTTGIDGCWTGDTYKAFVKFRHESRQTETYTIDTDWGCGVIRPSMGDFRLKMNIFFNHKYDVIPVENAINNWNVFDENRKDLLNLISIEDFKTRMNEQGMEGDTK